MDSDGFRNLARELGNIPALLASIVLFVLFFILLPTVMTWTLDPSESLLLILAISGAFGKAWEAKRNRRQKAKARRARWLTIMQIWTESLEYPVGSGRRIRSRATSLWLDLCSGKERPKGFNAAIDILRNDSAFVRRDFHIRLSHGRVAPSELDEIAREARELDRSFLTDGATQGRTLMRAKRLTDPPADPGSLPIQTPPESER